jgi:hypothetical protein
MHKIKLIIDSTGDWEGLYINDTIFHQDNCIPRDILTQECVKHRTMYTEIEVDGNFSQSNTFLPENFSDLDLGIIINPEVLATNDKLTDIDIQMLESESWVIVGTDDKFAVQSTETGCYAEGEWAMKFAFDKLQEIKEEAAQDSSITSKSWDETFTSHGFTMLSDSPLEIEDEDDNCITGECALFVKSVLTHGE